MEMDENAALNSSDSATPIDVTPDTGVDAAPSAAPESEAPDVASIVRDVVQEREGTASQAEDAQTAGQPGDQATTAEPDNVEYSDVPFNQHPRFRQVLSRMKAAEADAGRYQNVQRFLDQNGLGSEEAADALAIAGLMKTNPAEAWKRLQPVMRNLLAAAGEILPPELDQMVRQGAMTPEAALEVSRARAQVQSQQAYYAAMQERAAREQQEAQVRSLVMTAEQWEQDRVVKDPHFEAKRQPLMKELAYLQMTEGKPTDPAGVRSQLERAYRAVSGVGVQQPAARPAVRPVTGGKPGANAAPAPQTTLDIIRSMRRG